MTASVEPIWLNSADVIYLHTLQIQQYGGVDGLRSAELLHSAVHRPQHAFFYQQPQPTICQLAALYIDAILHNHAFIDGNKRTGLAACLVFLKINHINLHIPHPYLFDLTIDLANHRINHTDFAQKITDYVQ